METLREKLGPLPVWAWLALLTAAGLGWWLISRHNANAQPTPQAAANDVPQTVIQTPVTINENADADRDRDRDRKARRRPVTDREKERREERGESDRTEAGEKQARHRSRDREDREPHRPYHPPHGPGPTNHNPRQPQAA